MNAEVAAATVTKAVAGAVAGLGAADGAGEQAAESVSHGAWRARVAALLDADAGSDVATLSRAAEAEVADRAARRAARLAWIEAAACEEALGAVQEGSVTVGSLTTGPAWQQVTAQAKHSLRTP